MGIKVIIGTVIQALFMAKLLNSVRNCVLNMDKLLGGTCTILEALKGS